jgi:glycosyltransferase involved in cell wall biosynthesis
MHILITVHFNAQHGGLHENVFATVRQCLKRKHQVSVLCREGEFANRLQDLGVQVITTDYELIGKTTEKVLSAPINNYDVVHTHPGPSRKVALKVAEQKEIPIFATFHGMWYDSVYIYSDKYSAIFPVSEGVKDFLKEKVTHNHEKLLVMPNGVNKGLFTPANNFYNNQTKDPSINISLVTRLDKDKDFIIQLFYKALQYTYKHYRNKVTWTIVGDGSELEMVKNNCLDITRGDSQLVQFSGWKTEEALRDSYLDSDIVIAPGRCALEAMSCGKPVIAIGSKKYNGLVNKDTWMNGVYTNFGGVGNKFDDYIEGSIENDLKKVIDSATLREELGKLGIFITDQFYNEELINDKIIGIYEVFHQNNMFKA